MKTLLLILGVVLVGCHIYLAEGSIATYSPTYDEPVHLTAGYTAWKESRYQYNGAGHPPFSEMWAAFPLLFLNPIIPVHHPAWIRNRWGAYDQYQFADTFLFKNRVNFEDLLKMGRRSQVVMSVLLGVSLGVVAFYLGGAVSSGVALALWSFSPTVLGQATVITTDLAFGTFFFLFFASFAFPKSWKRDIFAGIFLGLSFSSKFPAISMIPILGLCLLWHEKFKLTNLVSKARLLSAGMIGIVSFVVIALVYRVSGLDVFWIGLGNVFKLAQGGRSSYFLGATGTEGWLLYFPVAVLLKTPIPILLAFLISLGFIIKTSIHVPAVLWIPPLAFFIIACLSKVHIGHRHIFIIYPFLFLLIAISFRHWMVWPLLGCLALGTFFARPHFLSYFNEFVGGSQEGYQYFTDSNVDWGQGLKLLSHELNHEDKEKGIYLSYFGVGDPHAYGIRYVDILSDSIAAHKDDSGSIIDKPTKFAISVTNLQSTYFSRKDIFDWVKKYQPQAQIANSIFLYDFSDNPEAISILEQLRRIER